MAQMNGMEKRNFTNSVQNGGKTAEMRNNSAKSGMVGMSGFSSVHKCRKIYYLAHKSVKTTAKHVENQSDRMHGRGLFPSGSQASCLHFIQL